MKTVIVTGALGQDGICMAVHLLNNTDHKIIGVYRRSSTPKFDRVEFLRKNYGHRYKLVCADITDQTSMDSLVQTFSPDYFINLAANSFVGCSWDMPVQVFDVNTLGVIRCLEAIKKFAPTCRFYSAGSSEEMGDVDYSPQDKAHPIKPRSPYGASKAAARHIVKVYRESYSLYAVHGILYNHEGVYRGEEFVTRKITKGVARIKKAIQEHKPFDPIELGNLDSKRDWSDAEDFVDGIWRMLNQEQYSGKLEQMVGDFDQTGHILLPKNVNPAWHKVLVRNIKEYILSSNETHSIREFVELAFDFAGIRTLGWQFPAEYGLQKDPLKEQLLIFHKNRIPLVVINPKFYRPAEVDILLGDSTPVRNELDWQPKTDFRSLVAKMVKNDLDIAGVS